MLFNSRKPEIVVDNLVLHPEEFCYHVYMPIKVGKLHAVPDNLTWCLPLIDKVKTEDWLNYEYWYLTVKHMWIDGYGNREGWHIDGFDTDDVNYIWADCIPTQFCIQMFDLSEDHNRSLLEMKEQIDTKNIWNASANQLLRLTSDIVHRPVESNQPTLRTFIKVSCSNSIYNLKGNATNSKIKGLTWEKVERKLERNHPIGEAK